MSSMAMPVDGCDVGAAAFVTSSQVSITHSCSPSRLRARAAGDGDLVALAEQLDLVDQVLVEGRELLAHLLAVRVAADERQAPPRLAGGLADAVVDEQHRRLAEGPAVLVGRGRLGGPPLEDGTGQRLVAGLEQRDRLAQGVDDLGTGHSFPSIWIRLRMTAT
jgi:hypothetical protein